MPEWYRQIANKPTGSAGGMTALEQKIEDVMYKDKSVDPDVVGGSIKGKCKFYFAFSLNYTIILISFIFIRK